MKAIQTKAIITSIRSRVDKSLGISFTTPELSSEEKALCMDYQGINVDMLITPLDELMDGVQKIDKDLESKTSSQRLRSVLFVLWKQRGEEGTFEDFYRGTMEKFIDSVKAKLED